MSNYDVKYRKRIIVFIIVTILYLIFTGTYTIYSIFVGHISWSDDGFLYAYCTYSIWFNGYSYYCYHRNSLEQEQKSVAIQKQVNEIYVMAGLEPFNHKKGRRHIFLISSLAIAVNLALMITTMWLW